MKRRKNGEGSIYQRKDGRWAASVSVGANPQTGKPKRKVLYALSEKEIVAKLKKFYKDNEMIDFTKQEHSLRQWFKYWLLEYKKNSLKPKSFQRYWGLYVNYIEMSVIGEKKLKDLKPNQIQEFINSSKASPNTLKYILDLMKSCLKEAINQDYIVKNPCYAVSLPRNIKPKKTKFLSVEEQAAVTKYLLKHINEGHNLMVYSCLSTGLREGELMGLEWSKIDFKHNMIFVNKTYSRQAIYKDEKVVGYKKVLADTKNDEVRYVPIPTKLISLLKTKHTEFLKDKVKNPKKYKKMELVFSRADGFFLNDKTPLLAVKRLYKTLNISNELTFHSLRHTYATRLYEKCGDLKVIQALLGHIDIDTTQKIYVHVSEEKKKEATQLLDAFLG